MKPVLFSLCLAWAIAQPAVAQAAAVPTAPAPIERSRKLIELLRLEDTYEAMFKQLTPILSQAVIGMMQSDPATRGALQTLFDHGEGGQGRFVTILSEEFMRSIRTRYPLLKEAAAAEYARVFTDAELGDLIAFYSSGTGAKTLQATPLLQQRISAAAQEVGRTAGAEAGQRAVERAAREMMPPGKPNKS